MVVSMFYIFLWFPSPFIGLLASLNSPLCVNGCMRVTVQSWVSSRESSYALYKPPGIGHFPLVNPNTCLQILTGIMYTLLGICCGMVVSTSKLQVPGLILILGLSSLLTDFLWFPPNSQSALVDCLHCTVCVHGDL